MPICQCIDHSRDGVAARAGPPIRIQQKIAAVLSACDDLIENNNRRIKLLEELAQRILGLPLTVSCAAPIVPVANARLRTRIFRAPWSRWTAVSSRRSELIEPTGPESPGFAVTTPRYRPGTWGMNHSRLVAQDVRSPS